MKEAHETPYHLVWGGWTSIGINAVQLAVAAGYEVIVTASPCNFGLLKRLGASAVFDFAARRPLLPN